VAIASASADGFGARGGFVGVGFGAIVGLTAVTSGLIKVGFGARIGLVVEAAVVVEAVSEDVGVGVGVSVGVGVDSSVDLTAVASAKLALRCSFND